MPQVNAFCAWLLRRVLARLGRERLTRLSLNMVERFGSCRDSYRLVSFFCCKLWAGSWQHKLRWPASTRNFSDNGDVEFLELLLRLKSFTMHTWKFYAVCDKLVAHRRHRRQFFILLIFMKLHSWVVESEVLVFEWQGIVLSILFPIVNWPPLHRITFEPREARHGRKTSHWIAMTSRRADRLLLHHWARRRLFCRFSSCNFRFDCKHGILNHIFNLILPSSYSLLNLAQLGGRSIILRLPAVDLKFGLKLLQLFTEGSIDVKCFRVLNWNLSNLLCQRIKERCLLVHLVLNFCHLLCYLIIAGIGFK